MSVTLFRQQAVDHQRFRIWGEVALAVPASYALMTAFLVLAVFAAALFIATQSYARKERAAGFLVPASGLARIVPARAGTIIAVSVAEGQRVERGAPLLTVTATETSERGENIDAAKTDQLRRERDNLKDQIALEREKSDIDGHRLQAQIDAGGRESSELERQLTVQAARIEIARQQLDGAIDLASHGYLSKVEMRRRQDAYLAERQSLSSLAREQAAKQAELAALQDNLHQLPVATAQRVSQLEGAIAEIETRLKEIEGRRGYQIQAPISGRVSTLQAWVGKAADPKIPLLSIVPDGDVLEAELLVPARAIGFVAAGQPVHISYDT